MAECLQCSLADGTCSYADIDPDTGLLTDADAWSEEMPYDDHGLCCVGGDDLPGDNCENYQTQWGDEYCQRSGDLKTECGCPDYENINECSVCGMPDDDCDCDND